MSVRVEEIEAAEGAFSRHSLSSTLTSILLRPKTEKQDKETKEKDSDKGDSDLFASHLKVLLLPLPELGRWKSRETVTFPSFFMKMSITSAALLVVPTSMAKRVVKKRRILQTKPSPLCLQICIPLSDFIHKVQAKIFYAISDGCRKVMIFPKATPFTGRNEVGRGPNTGRQLRQPKLTRGRGPTTELAVRSVGAAVDRCPECRGVPRTRVGQSGNILYVRERVVIILIRSIESGLWDDYEARELAAEALRTCSVKHLQERRQVVEMSLSFLSVLSNGPSWFSQLECHQSMLVWLPILLTLSTGLCSMLVLRPPIGRSDQHFESAGPDFICHSQFHLLPPPALLLTSLLELLGTNPERDLFQLIVLRWEGLAGMRTEPRRATLLDFERMSLVMPNRTSTDMQFLTIGITSAVAEAVAVVTPR
ncbi:hypothetical protein BDP27DRAFT_1370540 [Rhodocollybia butyracea]|uniref:Uncharacterized protein n=1 Tax=Rhodocollybia butyracea TaxID=206335 RepID=A0A9P5TYG6_9AGAR|nr:hypothetical protein BDP27DRAFT_1370540 [Rhodocollybia butyracea]